MQSSLASWVAAGAASLSPDASSSLMPAPGSRATDAFSVVVTPASSSGDPPCHQGPATVAITGAASDSVVAWDTEVGICAEGELYVHFVPPASSAPMTAGAGATTHTYKACTFDSVPVAGTGCQAFDGKGGNNCEEWLVARASTSCS